MYNIKVSIEKGNIRMKFGSFNIFELISNFFNAWRSRHAWCPVKINSRFFVD